MPAFRLTLLLLAAALVAVACGTYEEDDGTPPPVVIRVPADPPVVAADTVECPKPDVTYFIVQDQQSADTLARHIAAAHGVAIPTNQPFVPWAVLVGEYTLPAAVSVGGTLPADPVSIQIVAVDY